jgi:internalin A
MNNEELMGVIEQARQKEWEVLDLSGLGLSCLPPEIGNLTSCITLHW